MSIVVGRSIVILENKKFTGMAYLNSLNLLDPQHVIPITELKRKRITI